MRYVYDQPGIVTSFVARMLPHATPDFGGCGTIAICDNDGELLAGLVYHNYAPHAGTIEITGAALPGHQWATRETLLRMHELPFGACKCQMVTMKVRWENERLLRQLAALGYEFMKFPRMYGRGQDGVICYLTLEEWLHNRITQRLLRNLVKRKEAA